MTELILALDVTGGEEARAIAEVCAPYLDAIKIGYRLVFRPGLPLPGELESLDLPLIADFKVADIPSTNRLIAEQVFDPGSPPSYATVSPGAMRYRPAWIRLPTTGAHVSWWRR